jgi:glutamyl/glutaminyl-tRNA synthetase
VRIEDLDTPRTVNGAANDIFSTLEAYGLHWDKEIYQSRRTAAYEEAFHRLKEVGAVYPCACSRKEIANSALPRGDEWSIPARVVMAFRRDARGGRGGYALIYNNPFALSVVRKHEVEVLLTALLYHRYLMLRLRLS